MVEKGAPMYLVNRFSTPPLLVLVYYADYYHSNEYHGFWFTARLMFLIVPRRHLLTFFSP